MVLRQHQQQGSSDGNVGAARQWQRGSGNGAAATATGERTIGVAWRQEQQGGDDGDGGGVAWRRSGKAEGGALRQR